MPLLHPWNISNILKKPEKLNDWLCLLTQGRCAGSMSSCSMTWRRLLRTWLPRSSSARSWPLGWVLLRVLLLQRPECSCDEQEDHDGNCRIFWLLFFFPGMVYYRLQNNCIGYNVLASLVFLFQGVCVCCMTVVPAEGWRRHLDPLELLRSWRQLWVTVLLMWVLELNPGLLK